MMRYVLLTLLSVFVGLSPAELEAAGVRLESREYKLMLASGKFAGDEVARTVDRFWDEALKPVIDGRLDTRNDGTPRSKKNFKLDKERLVRFHDTKTCLFDRNGYSLRERVRLVNGDEDRSSREVTLDQPPLSGPGGMLV
jgi:hypothetical protein